MQYSDSANGELRSALRPLSSSTRWRGLPGERRVDQAGVDAQFLAGRRTRQQGEEERQVVHGRDKAFHPHQGDMHRRDGGAHAPIALVGHQHQRTGLCHAEVDPGEAHICLQEDIPQHLAGGIGEHGDFLGVRNAQFLLEEFPHVAASQVDRGGNDMAGMLAAQLDDVLAQVCLHCADPG